MHCSSCGVMIPSSSTTEPAPTNSGLSPYGPQLNYYNQNPYGISNFQSLPHSPQPQYPMQQQPTPPRRHKLMIGFILGAVALVLILGSVAVCQCRWDLRAQSLYR
jgi:hypothetical protein